MNVRSWILLFCCNGIYTTVLYTGFLRLFSVLRGYIFMDMLVFAVAFLVVEDSDHCFNVFFTNF